MRLHRLDARRMRLVVRGRPRALRPLRRVRPLLAGRGGEAVTVRVLGTVVLALGRTVRPVARMRTAWGCCHSLSSSDCALAPITWSRVPKHYGLGTPKRTVRLLVEKAPLELCSKVGRQDRTGPVHQKGHLVPNETDVRLRVCEHGERGTVGHGHDEQESPLHLHNRLIHAASLEDPGSACRQGRQT